VDKSSGRRAFEELLQCTPERLFATYHVAQKTSHAQAKQGLRPGVEPLPYQREVAAKVIAKNGSLLVSHPIGSGELLTSIVSFEAMRNAGIAERALIVASSLCANFLKNEVGRLTASNMLYHVIGYDLFRGDAEKCIDVAGADTVIYFRPRGASIEDALTVKAIKNARKHHRNFVGMIGPDIFNTPTDIIPLVDAMTDGKHLLGNKSVFEARFIEIGNDGRRVIKHPAVLHALLDPYIHHLDSTSFNTSATKN
jgi:hypothetical protein